ncbi:hypothetical protein GMDG_05897 [Pseudogymnoascus destructans 20631-21]|uniref:Involucrin repeat protein n=1 Tax=Pseudogymnoascus destructans (strain ATCC MYA-4855 / 20631-21) TaxID=658429 RepID=L8FQ06_PSED2|nr:hypothetical protein GMDG_05897 [Pseudogymnoascus destructans 20631-21]
MADARTRGEASGSRRKKRDSPSKQQDRRDAARSESFQTQTQPQPIYSNTRAAPIYAEPEEDLNLRGPRRYSSGDVSSSSSSYIDISRRSPIQRRSAVGFFRSFFAAPDRRRRVKKQRSRASMKLGNSSSSSVDSNLAYGTGFLKKRKERYVSPYGSRRERKTSGIYAPAGRAPGKKRKEKDVETEILEVGAGLAALARKQNRMDLIEARKQGVVHIKREDSGIHGLGVKGVESSRGLGSSKPSHGADEDGWESASDDESCSSSSVDLGLAYGGENTWNWGRPRPPMPVKRKSTIVDPKLFGPQNSLNGVLSRPVGFGEVDINAPGGFMPEPFSSAARDTGYVSPQQPPPAPSLRGKDDGYIPTAGPARRGSAQSSGSLQHVFPMPTDDPLNFDACRRSVASVQDRPIYNVSRTDSLPLRQPKPFTPVSQTIYEQSSIPAHVDSTPRKRDSGSKRESGSKRDSGGYATFAGAGLAGVALAGMAANRLEKRRNEDDYERAKRRERRNKEVREPEDDRERRRENRRESERYEKSDRLRDSRRDDEQRDYRPDERRERRRGEEREETRTSRQLVSATRPDPFQYQVADDAFEIADRPHKSRQAAADGPSARALEKAPERALGSAPELPMDNLDIGSTIERGHTPDIVTVERVPRFARGGARTSKVPAASTARDDGPSETRGRSREKSPEQIRVVRVVTDEPSAAPSDAAAAEYSSPTKREFKKGKRKSYSASTERERDLIQEDADRVYRETTAANKAAAKEPAPRPVTPENNDEDKEKGPYDSPNADFELDHVMHPEDMPTFSPVVLRAYPASQSCEIEGPFDPATMGLSRPLLNLVYPTPTPEAQKLRGAKAAPETKDREISDRDIVTVSPSEPKGVKWGEDEVKSFVPVTPHDEAADPIHKAAAPEPVKKKPSRWGDIRGAFIARAAEIKAEEAAEEKARAAEAPASPAEPFEYRGITVEPEHANDRDASLERDLPRDDHRDPGPPPSVGPKPTAAVESRGMPGAFDDDIDFAATLAAGLQDSGFDPNIVINDSSFARRSSPPGSDVETVVYHKPFSETVTDLGVYERHPSGPSDGPVLEEASRKIDEEEFPVSKKLSKKEQKKLEKEEAKRARDHEFDGAEAAAVAAVAAAAVAGVAHHYAGEREVAEPEQHADETDEFSFSKKLSKKEQKKLEKEAAKLAMDREFEAAEAEAAATAADHEVVGERTDEADDFAFTKKLSKKEQKKLERDAAKLAQEEEDAAREREHEAMMAQIVVEHEVVGPQDEADEFAYGKKLTKKEQKKLEKEAAKLAQDKEFEDAKAEAANSRAVEEPEEVWGEEAREVPEFFDRGRIAVPGAPQEEIRDEFDDFDAFMPKLSKKEQKKLEKEAAAAKLAEEKELAEAEAAKLAQDKEFAEAEAANNHPVEEPKVQSRELQDDEFKEADEFTKKLSKKEQKKLEKEAAKLAQDKEFEEAEAANSHAVEEPEAWDQEHQEDEFKGAEESAPKLSKIEQKRLDKEAAKLAQDKEFEEVEAASSRAVEEPKAWVQEPQEDEFKEAEEGFVFTKKLSKKEQKKLEKEQAKQARDREIELEEAGEGLHAIVEEPETSKSQGEDDKEADEFAFTKKLSKKEQKRLDKEAENLARDRELELEQTEVPGTQTPKEADEFAEFSTSKKSNKSKKSRKSAGYPDDDEEVPATKISVPIDAFDDLRHDDATAGLVDEWDAPKKSKRMSRRGDEVFEDAQESISRKGSKKDKSRGNADSDRSQIRSVVSEPVEDDTRSVTSESKKKSRGSGFFGFFGGSSNKSDVSESEKAVKLVGADEAYDLSNGHSPIEGSNGISNGNGHEAHEEDEWASTTKSKKKKKKQKNGIADDEASEQDSF